MARKTNKFIENKNFLIITNGKETEVNYFKLLKNHYKSPYTIKIEFQNNDPLQLVDYAIQKNNQNSYNQIWVVFDVDKTHIDGKFEPAIAKASKNNIKFAFSNLAFEVWLISHFKIYSKESNIKELMQTINEYLKSKNYKNEYKKGNKEILEKFFIKDYKTAISNAKQVFQTKLKEHNQQYGTNVQPKFYEWNSCTNVFDLIEALKLSK